MFKLKRAAFAVFLGISLPLAPLLSQERPQPGHHPPQADSTAVTDSAPGAPMQVIMPERPFGIPMTRMGSGTAWLPDASAMRAWHFTRAGWMLMVHGDAFVQFDHQGGPRGADQFGSINWGMLMAMRQVRGGT